MEQEEIIINNVEIPIIKEEGEIWYPIKYMSRRVLLKDMTANQLIKNGYGEYIKQFEIDFGKDTGAIQFTYCINTKGLKQVLSKSKIGKLNIEQKKAMNNVLDHLRVDKKICECDRFTYKIPNINKYNEYIQDCINDIMLENPNIMWQQCSKCNNIYPYHINFFNNNPHAGKDYKLYTFCRDCCKINDWIRNNDRLLSNMYKGNGLETYKAYKNHDVVGIYNDWINKKYSKYIPKIIRNKESYLLIIKYLYDNNKINNNFTLDQLEKQFNLNCICSIMKSEDIYNYLFDDEPINYPWKFKNYCLPNNLSMEQQKKIFNNYLEYNDIKILDIYNFNYSDICYKCRLKTHALKNILQFVMDYYDNIYPAYKFKIHSKNYWDNKDNRVNALKYLIEQDMKIIIEKVPLYLTLENLRKQSNTLRNILRNYYDNNLWLWVNELYPDRFVEEDFNVTVIRNVFDSAEESLIHDVLINSFKNVIYNQRNTKNTIKILDMIPDWVIITDNGFYIVEYFGISIDHKNYNQRIEDYKIKTLSKIDKYESLKWLRAIYVYPEDLKDNFKGLKDKINVIE